MHGSSAALLTSRTLRSGSWKFGDLRGLPAEAKLERGKLGSVPPEANLEEGELSSGSQSALFQRRLTLRLEIGELRTISPEANLEQGELSTLVPEANLEIGRLIGGGFSGDSTPPSDGGG